MRIDFPSDMPVSSSLTSVSGSTMFTGSISFTPNYGSNYIEVNGCSAGWEFPSATIFLNSIKNAG